MTPLRKHTVDWILCLTVLAVSTIGGSFVFLSDEIPTDPAFIETHLETSQHFDVTGARKHYSDQEIAAFVVKANQSEFNRQWFRLLSIVGTFYLVSALGVVAIMLRRESKTSTQRG